MYVTQTSSLNSRYKHLPYFLVIFNDVFVVYDTSWYLFDDIHVIQESPIKKKEGENVFLKKVI